MTASDDPLPPPYLTLSIPQALSLPPPSHPEQATWDSITDVLDHRARYQGDQVACGFAEKILQEGTWHTSTLSEFCRFKMHGHTDWLTDVLLDHPSIPRDSSSCKAHCIAVGRHHRNSRNQLSTHRSSATTSSTCSSRSNPLSFRSRLLCPCHCSMVPRLRTLANCNRHHH